MNTALFARTNGVIEYLDSAVDFSAKNGLTVAYSAGGTGNDANQGGGGFAIGASTSVPDVGVVLDGQVANRVNAIGILGEIPPVRMYASGLFNKGQRVQQDGAGGVVVDAGAGNQRVVIGVALEACTAAGQYVLIQTIAPVPSDTW